MPLIPENLPKNYREKLCAVKMAKAKLRCNKPSPGRHSARFIPVAFVSEGTNHSGNFATDIDGIGGRTTEAGELIRTKLKRRADSETIHRNNAPICSAFHPSMGPAGSCTTFDFSVVDDGASCGKIVTRKCVDP